MSDILSGRIDDTATIPAAEVTFDGSTSTVAGPSVRWADGPRSLPVPSLAPAKDVCMPTRVSIAGQLGEPPKIARVERRPSHMGSPGTSSCSPCGAIRPVSPVGDSRRLTGGSVPSAAGSPSSRTAACSEAQQLRGEVLELRALLQRNKAAHAEEASRLQFQVQDLEATLRHEHGLREDAERGERVANSQRDELQRDMDLLQQQLQVARAGLQGVGASEGTLSPRRRLAGDDLRALGTEILQVRQDSQDLRGLLLTRQHEAELRRLRGDLAETERAARAAQAELRHAEDAHELQLSTETATMRRLEQRCRFLEHGAEAAEAELTTTSKQLVALEATRKKLERDLACQQEAGRQAQALKDAAAEDHAQTKEELEQTLLQTKRELKSLKWQYDQLAADRDQSLEKVGSLEAALKSADLRQAVECACYWTEQDAAKAAESRATNSEELAVSLRRTVYRLEGDLGHQRAIAMASVPRDTRPVASEQGLWGLSGKLAQVLALLDASSLEEGIRRLREESADLKARLPAGLHGPADQMGPERADIELRQQYAAAESKVAQLQDAVAFLTQRAAIGAANEAKAGKAQDMLKKDLRRYEALERQLQHVQDRSKLSELEMLMQGIETEKDALQNNLEVSQARAVSLENQVMQEDLQNRRLRSEMHSSEKQAEKLHGHLQRLDLELSQAGSDRNALEACRTELQAKRLELEMMQAQLRNADAARDHAAAEMSSASEADLNAQKALVERLEVRLAGMQDAWEDHAQRLATSNAKARRLEDVLDTQARDLQQQVSRHQVEEELCRKLTTACAELEDEAFQHRQQADALKSETAAQKAKEVTMEAVADRREADVAHLTRLLEEVRGECRDHRASCLRHQATICELQHFQQEVAEIRAETGAQIETLENEGRQLALECAELRAALRDAEDVQGRERQALLAEHAELERASALHQSAVSQSTKQRDVLSKQLLELQEEAQEQQYQLAGMARQEATQQHRFGLIQQELTAELGQAAQRGDRAEAALADALAKGAAMLKQNQGLLRDHEEKDAASSERSTKLLSMLGEVQDALAQSQAVANQHQGDAESWKIAHEKLQEELTTVKTRCRSAELQLQDSQGELQVCQSGKERAEQSIRRLQEQVGKVSDELGSLQQAHDRKESGLTNSEMRLSELQMKADRLARERTELEAELEKARKETQQSVAEAQSLLQQKRSEVAELRATRNESRAQQEQLVVLHKDLEDSQRVHEKLQEELANVKTRCRSAEMQLQESQGQLQVCQSGKERAEQSIRRLQEQVGKVSDELGSLQQAHDRKESGLTSSEMRLSELQIRADQASRERTELEAELEKARKDAQQSVAEAQSLLQQKRSEVAELRATRNESRAQQEQLLAVRKDLEESRQSCRGLEQGLSESSAQLQMATEQRRHWTLKREYQERAILGLEEQVCSLNEEMCQSKAQREEQQAKLRSAEHQVMEMEQTTQVMARIQDKALGAHASKEEAAAARLVELEASLSQLRSQLALRESEAQHHERQAESTAARVKVLEAKDAACGKRTAVAEARAAELESKLRQLHATSAHVQEQLGRCRAEQLQLASEKSHLEDQCLACQRRLSDAEAQVREAQAEREHWKAQQKVQEDRACQWEAKVGELLRDLHKIQSEGLPQLPSHAGVQERPEVGPLLRQFQTSAARENAVQSCLLAAHGKLEESYMEAQRRLVAAEERLQELREECAYGPPIQMPERVIPPVPEEPRVEPVVGNGWDAQVHEDLRAQAAELRELSQQNDALLAENQGYKVNQVAFEAKTMKLEASVQRMRGDVEQMSAELQEAEGRLIHAEGAARRAEAVRLGDAGRSEALLSENSKLREEVKQLEAHCRGQSEAASEQLRSALGLEKRLMSVRQKHVRLQDAYREQGRTRPKGVEEDSIAAIQMATDELKEELSQLREEAAHERANREHADELQENVELAVKRLHSEELQGFQSEQHALRVQLQEQRRHSTEALEAQRWAVRKEKQLRKQRYALLLAASEELRFALQRLRCATEDAALADETTEDHDRRVTEELDEVKLNQQELQASRALEQERLQNLEEVQQELKAERRSSHQNEDRLRELMHSEQRSKAAFEEQEAAVVEDKRRLNSAYRQLEEAHAEERSSREKAEDFHQQVAAETQLLAVELLKLQGAFEEDGQSESNFSSMSRFGGSRLLVEVASGSESSEDESPGSQDPAGRASQQALTENA